MARPAQPARAERPLQPDTKGMSQVQVEKAMRAHKAKMAAYKASISARAEWLKLHGTDEEKAEDKRRREKAKKILGPLESGSSEKKTSKPKEGEDFQALMNRKKREARAADQA